MRFIESSVNDWYGQLLHPTNDIKREIAIWRNDTSSQKIRANGKMKSK